MGTACAPRPLVLLPRGALLYGPPAARSVAAGRCIFVIAGFARLRQRAFGPSGASVRKQMTGAARAPWPLALLPHGAPPRGSSLARSVAPCRCMFAILNLWQLLADGSVETWVCSPATVRHRALCVNVCNQTMGTACAPRPLALLPRDAPKQGPL